MQILIAGGVLGILEVKRFTHEAGHAGIDPELEDDAQRAIGHARGLQCGGILGGFEADTLSGEVAAGGGDGVLVVEEIGDGLEPMPEVYGELILPLEVGRAHLTQPVGGDVGHTNHNAAGVLAPGGHELFDALDFFGW